MISTFQYCEKYYKTFNYKDYLLRENKYKMMSKELSGILKHLNCNSVLDFGCSVGFTVKHLNSLGFKCFGYDCSEWAIDYGRKNFTKKITTKCNILKKNYDAIFFLDVLEHNFVNVIHEIFSVISTKYIFIRIPVCIDGEDSFYFKESRSDETHVVCMSKKQWNNLFLKLFYSEIIRINCKFIWDSPGVYCAVLEKIR